MSPIRVIPVGRGSRGRFLGGRFQMDGMDMDGFLMDVVHDRRGNLK